MRDKIWINKSKSFEDANEFDDTYYLSMSKIERIETVQFLREEYWKKFKGQDYEDRKRIRRVFKTIKQT